MRTCINARRRQYGTTRSSRLEFTGRSGGGVYAYHETSTRFLHSLAVFVLSPISGSVRLRTRLDGSQIPSIHGPAILQDAIIL